ncbi:MAG: FHA domain-containing protein [Actinomycetales bacterium]|nr:FHA domain-containing protein [Actinomycetales bacterium]
MSELTLTLLRLGFLALLWLLVLSVVGVIRRDLYGTQITHRPSSRPAPGPAYPQRGRAPAERRWPRVLVVTEGSLQGTTLALGQAPILIGRAPECTLVLEDDYASTRHARLFPQESGWFVEDLGSTNGTFIGRTRVEGAVPLDVGVPVRVGRTVLELRR